MIDNIVHSELFELISMTSEGTHFYVIFGCALLLLTVFAKGYRRLFIIPALLISAIIINPWFYKIWDKLNLYAYWRILWIIPVIPICASVPALFAERISNDYIKVLIAVAAALTFCLAGSFIYAQPASTFEKAKNPSKLPQYVVDTAEFLLKRDDHPRIIADERISTNIREYTGKIDSIFGRDIRGYILPPRQEAKDAFEVVRHEYGDVETLSHYMLNENYQYLIVLKDSGLRRELLAESGYKKLGEIDIFGIYQVTGYPDYLNERNALGQVIKRTYVDNEGKTINGPEGYAFICYEYDKNGDVAKRTFFNASGELIKTE